MIDGIIFDMDGVLIDSEHFYMQRRLEFCRKNGIKPQTILIEDFIGATREEIWNRLIPEALSQNSKLKQDYDDYCLDHPTIYTEIIRPEVKSVFQKIKAKDKKIAIASSSPRKEIDRMLETTNLRQYVDFVISGEELTESKPNPEIYLIAKNALGHGRFIAIEDSQVGIQSAKSAGLYTVALKPDFRIDQTAADRVIDNLKQLLEYV